MNDRVSNRPPSIYIKPGDATEGLGIQSHENHPPHIGARMDGTATSDDSGIEVARPSGVYRFGRALVNAFKPITVWRGFGNIREEKDPNFLSEKIVMQERQLKAEKAYAELKRNGYKGTQPSSRTVETLAIPVIKVEPVSDESRHFLHRDSGVDVDGYYSSTEQERSDQVLECAKTPIPSAPASAARRMVSPLSNTSSARKPSLHFRKPSFQSLKKVKSQVQLPAIKKQCPTEPGAEGEDDLVEQHLRKQASRKDIAKHVKLSKKISDLEAQLEIARRNLNLSFQEAPADFGIQSYKGPRTFKPGGLPSLPSERILSKALANGKGGESFRAEANAADGSLSDRKAVVKPGGDCEEIFRVDSASQLEKELVDSFNQHNISKKRNRASRHDQDIPSPTEQIDVNELRSNTVEGERPKRKLRSSSKMQENNHTNANVFEMLEEGNVPRPPHNSPNKALEAVPPLPTTRISFDPSQVDQARLLSMRFIGDMKTPFGKHPEDFGNLRKEFPTVSVHLLARYLDNLSKDSKVTDHASLAHHNQGVAPLLARPRSVSPIKAEPRKAPKHRKSALQTCYHNSNSISQVRNTDSMERKVLAAVELVNPPIQLPFSNSTPIAEERKIENEKPLPVIQKEEYEWPDDVF